MMTMDPLKSAISIGNVEETSLALPSDNKLRSKQQRVLDQVQTIKRGKSKYSKNGSLSSPTKSPTSPMYVSVFTDSIKSPTSPNGIVFSNGTNGLSRTLSHEQSTKRMVLSSKGSTVQRNMSSSSQWERRLPLSPPIARGQRNSSHSVPDADPFPFPTTTQRPAQAPASALQQFQSSAPARQLQSNRSSFFLTERGNSQFISNDNGPSQVIVNSNDVQKRHSQLIGTRQTKSSGQITSSHTRIERAPSNPSMAEPKISMVKSKIEAGMNDYGQLADITMAEAVQYLSSGDVNYQHYGASFIQHSTYSEDKAKQEVLRLKGIPPLVNLLRSPSPQVQQTASAALRNLAFKDAGNKEEVQRCGGITESLALLRDTDSTETQKQLTGLLWNLSSADSLKPELVRSALPVLTETVVVPYTGGVDETNKNLDPEVFYHATACLRNLSCATQSNRQAMRNCRGLIDSLGSYVQECVASERPDDKSVENCVCVLHNLSFQLESEAPALFSRITALAGTISRANASAETGPIGCFSQQSSKVQEQENHFDYPVMEEQHPKGAGWLFHSKTMQSYLSLLRSSQREDTLEACCGALQNLTANQGIVSRVMSQTIVQKLNGLPEISPLLQSSNPSLQKTAVALVGNLAKNQRLQSIMARQTFPELVGILSSWTKEGTESDDTLAMACQTSHSLLMKEPELGKRLLSNNLVNSLNDLSKNRLFPKASKAAGVLLYSLWSEKDIQSFLKKQGMNKGSFVNDITSVAHRSVQVVE
ncbi:plakophilin-1 [Oncorhynchus tshawytscha]|uniref:Plakophilin 1b n=1 Tax=Oncorhynchus tshawytscha TaxID=74940 RepID=A0A8C8BTI9_ONCTS|nr:plakophilin-1 [Oncorhynchus tshawytscha]